MSRLRLLPPIAFTPLFSFLLLIALLWAAPVMAQQTTAQDQPLFDARTFTLDNGLQVVVVENHRVPVVNHMVWYRVGAADEPPGKSGISHLLEHLMFKGTERIGPGEFSAIIARHGGQQNAFASSDFTGYFQNIAADRLELVMEMEADRMANLRLDEDEVITERAVVIEERLARVENEPAALLGERLDIARWTTHPYGNPVIGWQHELETLTRQDALDFYERWYAPNNAIVVVSGAVTVDRVREIAERTYGQVPSGPEIVRARAPNALPEAEVRVEMRHARVAQPQWRRDFHAPSYGTVAAGENGAENGGDDTEILALQVLSELLGGGRLSRIYQSLVVDQELAVSAGSWYSASAVDGGTFGLYFTPRPGVTVAQVEAAMEAEIDHLLAEGVSVEEVDDAKTRMRAGVIYARDSLQGAARTIGGALITGATLEQVETWPARVATVTAGQVMDAAQAVLRRDASATGVLLPEPPRQTAGVPLR